jgi:hypothetical protein
MATKSLTFNKIEGITSGSAFTVNAFANDKTVTATVYFSPLNLYADISKVTPKIGSVKVGGQNWLSTEIIKITYEFGTVNSNGVFTSRSNIFPSSSHQVSEKDGTVPSSVSLSSNKAENAHYFYSDGISYFAYKITIESTQNLVGCKVVMSDFQLSVDYTITQHTLTLYSSPAEGGTVSGGGTYNDGTTVTMSATPNSGYAFKEWRQGSVDGLVSSTNKSVSFVLHENAIFYAIFVKTTINKIYIGTSQPKEIYVGTQKVKAVYIGTTKVYG